MLIPENRENHKKRSLSVSRYLKEIRRPEVVTSETLVLAAFLAFVGGYQDAYSFIGRQRVFANAQTGNLILLGVNAVSGNLEGFIRYLIPVSCFTLGILAACILRSRVGNGRFLHWRQRVLILEMLLLSVNLFLPFGSLDIVANSLISLSCAIQVETFKRFRGLPAATTMCIGNLKSGMENLYAFIETGERRNLSNFKIYLGIIGVFVIGAVIGAKCTEHLQQYAMLPCVLMLFLPFFLLFTEARDVE